MANYDVDLFVIGGGSGGLRAAKAAAGYGATVMLAEEYRIGGTCVIRGCVPKKIFVYASRYADLVADAPEFGWILPLARFDWQTLLTTKDRETGRLENLLASAQKNLGVEVVKSRATLVGPHTIRLGQDQRLIRAERILIATGAAPAVPSFEGHELGVTSDEIFSVPELPKSIVIAGAGYVAVEFAALFASLGSQVTIVCRGESLLRGFDEDIRKVVAESFLAKGIRMYFNEELTRLQRCWRTSTDPLPSIQAFTTSGRELTADQVLYAYGRKPNTDSLGLEDVEVDRGPGGAVLVDEDARTSVPSIFAVGDVTNRVNLTPVAIREGQAFAEREFGGESTRVDYSLIPTAVFTSPEIGCIGLTEKQAREQFEVVDVYKTSFRSMRQSAARGGEHTFFKLVVHGISGAVLGVHLFAEDAAELIQSLAVALRAGATIRDFQGTMAVHPTLGEEIVTMTEPTARYDRSAQAVSAPAIT